jgi:hypothetical protein
MLSEIHKLINYVWTMEGIYYSTTWLYKKKGDITECNVTVISYRPICNKILLHDL